MSGEGYVLHSIKSTQMNAIEVHLVAEKEFDEKPTMGDVSVVVPVGSPDYKKAKKFKPGQKVSFSGRMDDLFEKTICIKGSVKITAK